jgi:hypothetical protein
MLKHIKLLIICITLTLVAGQVLAAGIQGTVVETMNAGGYTFVQIDNSGQKLWAAAPKTQVMVGDEVEVVGGMEMKNFTSKSLGRTFPSIFFAQRLTKAPK